MEGYPVFLILLLGFLCSQITENEASGVIAVKFVKYENKDGTGANGHCCDGKWGICQIGGCDHMFTLCLSPDPRSNKTDTPANCPFGRVQSDAIDNENTITFKKKVANLTNPILFRVNSIPPAFSIKINVFDEDSKTNDFVDYLQANISFDRENWRQNVSRNYTLSPRTKLDMNVSYWCDPDYYGRHCDANCPAPPAHNAQYVCDPNTGQKICTNASDSGLEGFSEGCSRIRGPDEGPLYPSEPSGPSGGYSGPSGGYPGPSGGYPGPSGGYSGGSSSSGGNTYSGGYGPSISSNRPGEGSDCEDRARAGQRSGQYAITPRGGQRFDVYCEMDRGEGWTVIQRRTSSLTSFNQGWRAYRDGFGSMTGTSSFWLGLEKIYQITNAGRRYKLKVILQKDNGQWVEAIYDDFSIEDERQDYRLHVMGFEGTAGDGLNYLGKGGERMHDGMRFTTADHDRDSWRTGNCAQRFSGGWWFNKCLWSNLNGEYRDPSRTGVCDDGQCIMWLSTDNNGKSFRKAEMRIKPSL